MVFVYSFQLIKNIGSWLLALDASASILLCLLDCGMECGPLQISALAAQKHAVKLRVHRRSLRDHTVELHERIQMKLSQIAQFVLNGQTLHSDIDLSMDLVVVWEDFSRDLSCCLVKNGQHAGWLFSKPNSQIRNLVGQTDKVNLERLQIRLAHFLDALFVNMHIVFIGVVAQKVSKFAANEKCHIILRDPGLQTFTFRVSIVVNIL